MAFVKINRDIFKTHLFHIRNSEKFHAFLDLVQMASIERLTHYLRGVAVEVEKYEVIAGRKYLADRWNWSEQKVRTFIKELEKVGLITKRTTNQITILKLDTARVFDDQQPSKQPINQPTPNQPLTNPQPYNKNIRSKESKELENKTVCVKTSGEVDERVISKNDFSNFSKEEQQALKNEKAEKEKKLRRKKEKEQIDKITHYFNSFNSNLPRVSKITETRKKACLKKLKSYSMDEVLTVIRKIHNSEFLNGENKSGFKAGFDWMLAPRNFIKILEGNYDTKKKKQEPEFNDFNF